MQIARDEIDRAKKQFDLRYYVEGVLGRPVSRGPVAWTFKCPFHKEQKGAALAVWADGWECFGACQRRGDAISFLRDYHPNMSMEQAVALMGGDPNVQAEQPGISVKRDNQPRSEPPLAELQAAALELVDKAQECLHSSYGRAGLEYLMQDRRLTENTIRDARLGYIRPSKKTNWIANGIKMPGHCITMPWFAGGHLWGVKCRLLNGGDLRYLNFKVVEESMGDFNIDGSLYWADEVLPGWNVLVVEGEFNALTAWQCFPDVLCTVSLGPAGHTLNPRWYGLLASAPTIYSLFDEDDAGNKGSARLASLSSAVRQVKLPTGIKDLNDFKRITFNARLSVVFEWAKEVFHAA